MAKPTRDVPTEMRPLGGWVASFLVIFFGAAGCTLIAIAGADNQSQAIAVVVVVFSFLAAVPLVFWDRATGFSYELPASPRKRRKAQQRQERSRPEPEVSSTPAGWHNPHEARPGGSLGIDHDLERAAAAAARVLDRSNERIDRRDPNFTPTPFGEDWHTYEPEPYDEDEAWRAREP